MTPPRNEPEPPRDTCDAKRVAAHCSMARRSVTTSTFDRTVGPLRRATYGCSVAAAIAGCTVSVYVNGA
jgi:hypothetical protein